MCLSIIIRLFRRIKQLEVSRNKALRLLTCLLCLTATCGKIITEIRKKNKNY